MAQSNTPLQLHPNNPHYFLFKNKPTVIVGSGEHYGAVINLDFDYKTYLQTLGKDKLNHTRLFTGAYIEKLGDFGIQKNTLAPVANRVILPWKRSKEAGYELGGNKFDLNQWDEAYFTRLKDFIAEANRNDVLVEVCLFSSHYGDSWNYSALNPKNNINKTATIDYKTVNTLENGNILGFQERYVRKIVQELNQFDNIYFEIQNEPWADQADLVLLRNEFGDEKDWRNQLQVVSQKSNDWQREVARWIKEEESKLPKKHLISQNISNFYYPVENPDPAISIFNYHYALPKAVTQNWHLNKAIGFNETGFAGSDDKTYQRQAWRFLMGGGALFSHLDYSFSVGEETGQDTTYKSPGGGSPALRQQFRVLKEYFDKLNFITYSPQPSFVIAAPGYSTMALGDGVSQWIVYLEPLTEKSNELTLHLPAGTYEAEWTDVNSGTSLEKTTLAASKISVPAGLNDKVLLINRSK